MTAIQIKYVLVYVVDGNLGNKTEGTPKENLIGFCQGRHEMFWPVYEDPRIE